MSDNSELAQAILLVDGYHRRVDAPLVERLALQARPIGISFSFPRWREVRYAVERLRHDRQDACLAMTMLVAYRAANRYQGSHAQRTGRAIYQDKVRAGDPTGHAAIMMRSFRQWEVPRFQALLLLAYCRRLGADRLSTRPLRPIARALLLVSGLEDSDSLHRANINVRLRFLWDRTRRVLDAYSQRLQGGDQELNRRAEETLRQVEELFVSR